MGTTLLSVLEDFFLRVINFGLLRIAFDIVLDSRTPHPTTYQSVQMLGTSG